MKHHSYGVVESIVSLVTGDSPASITGVDNGPWAPFPGIQATGYQLSPEVQKLIVEGRPVAQEGEIDEIPVTFRFGQFSPDIDSLIANLCAWYKEDGSSVLAVTEDFANRQFSMKCRIPKIGVPGMEKVVVYPKLQLSGLNRSAEQRQFHPNEYTVAGYFPDAKYPVYKDGVKVYRSVPVFEYVQPAGSPLYTPVSTAPTVVSVNGDTEGDLEVTVLKPTLAILFSLAMNLNSVNDLTVTLKDGDTLIDCICTPVTTGLNAYKLFNLVPVNDLTDATPYTLNVSTVVRSRDNVRLASLFTKTINVNLP